MAAQKHNKMPIMETLIIWGANVNAADGMEVPQATCVFTGLHNLQSKDDATQLI